MAASWNPVIFDMVIARLGRGIAKALGMAEGMTYKGVHPTTMLVNGEYPKGVKLDKKSMRPYGKCLDRLANLGKWFIKISSSTAAEMIPKIAN